MAKENSQTFCGIVVLMIFMVFWVSFVTAAKAEKPVPGRNDTKGKQINVNHSFFQLVQEHLLRTVFFKISAPRNKYCLQYYILQYEGS